MDRTLPQVNEGLCSRCGLCIEACPCGSAELQEEGVLFSCPEVCTTTVGDSCNCSCLCEEVCPTGAISCAFDIVLGGGEEAKPTGKAA